MFHRSADDVGKILSSRAFNAPEHESLCVYSCTTECYTVRLSGSYCGLWLMVKLGSLLGSLLKSIWLSPLLSEPETGDVLTDVCLLAIHSMRSSGRSSFIAVQRYEKIGWVGSSPMLDD